MVTYEIKTKVSRYFPAPVPFSPKEEICKKIPHPRLDTILLTCSFSGAFGSQHNIQAPWGRLIPTGFVLLCFKEQNSQFPQSSTEVITIDVLKETQTDCQRTIFGLSSLNSFHFSSVL